MSSIAAIMGDMGWSGSISNLLGGILGIVFFTYLGSYIRVYLAHRFPNKFGKRFTPTSRRLVKVKQRFGLGGIAAITPVILSIPVGVIFALALTTNKRKIMVSMIASCVLWSVVFFTPYFVFGEEVRLWLSCLGSH